MLAQEDQHQHQHQHQQMMMIKGKRTKRPRPASPLALTMSNTASASGDESGRVATSSSTTTTNTDSGAQICNSPTGTTTTMLTTEEEEDMAHCLILLAQGGSKFEKPAHHDQQQEYSPAVMAVSAARTAAAATTVGGGMYMYECKTCNRCFPSFQALGGHRASHKKPKLQAEEKGVALSLMDDNHLQPDYFQSVESSKNKNIEGVRLSLQIACNSSNTLSASNTHNDNNKLKVHACAICGAEFSSGQALGGHMRRHRSLIASGSGSPAAQSSSPPAPPRNLLSLDLNLPAEEQEDQQKPQSPKFMFTSNEKTLVFAASLVDCRY